MSTVEPRRRDVKSRRPVGRPSKRTREKEREIVRLCLKSVIINGTMPDDGQLRQMVGLGERTTRDIRLKMGLNRHEVARWIKGRSENSGRDGTDQVICWTSYAGLWLLVPLLLSSPLLSASQLLQWTVKTGVAGQQLILTIIMWTMLGFRRFFHLEDFRHQADLGLALFTGRKRLLSDSTVWRLVHHLKPRAERAFYKQTAAEAIGTSEGDEWLSLDEHVVGFFTKLKPRPLGKTRVASRGRYYPAIRLYAPFWLAKGRFIGLIVTRAGCALSQIVPTLIKEIRILRAVAGHERAREVDILIDRGGYKGELFERLMTDDELRFIAMSRATNYNVRQWAAVAEDEFVPYQPAREQNPHLKIAETYTQVTGCRFPLRTVLIRDDSQDSEQRWRGLFTKLTTEEMLGPEVDATYRRRQDHENSFAEVDHYLAGKCLPKPYRLLREANEQGQKRKTVATEFSIETLSGLHLVAWLRHWTFNLIKDFGANLGGPYARMRVGTLIRKFIIRPGFLHLHGDELRVTLMPFNDQPALVNWLQQLNRQRLPIPWLNGLILQIEIARSPVGLAAQTKHVRRRIFANSRAPTTA